MHLASLWMYEIRSIVGRGFLLRPAVFWGCLVPNQLISYEVAMCRLADGMIDNWSEFVQAINRHEARELALRLNRNHSGAFVSAVFERESV